MKKIDNSYHIIFDKNYYLTPNFGQRNHNHPTWSFNKTENIVLKFGGELENDLNHLISFENVIIDKNEINKVVFGINFEDFFNAQINNQNVFYKHSKRDIIKSLNKNIIIEHQYSNYPLKETTVKLAITPTEFLNQEWEGNSNKIGGSPIWVQEKEDLCCPKCNKKMHFVFQLDSGLPDLNPINDYEIMFGNDGMLYTFWCDKDNISGYLWQST